MLFAHEEEGAKTIVDMCDHIFGSYSGREGMSEGHVHVEDNEGALLAFARDLRIHGQPTDLGVSSQALCSTRCISSSSPMKVPSFALPRTHAVRSEWTCSRGVVPAAAGAMARLAAAKRLYEDARPAWHRALDLENDGRPLLVPVVLKPGGRFEDFMHRAPD